MQYKEKLYLARNFRKNQTDAEQVLWNNIRDRKFHNYKFKRQYIILNYILDFYCPELHIAIEIDGSVHDEIKNRNKDKLRQELIEKTGIEFIRLVNEEIITNIDNVLLKLEKTMIQDISPLSRNGEGGTRGVRTESIFAHAFNLIPSFGPVRIQKLLKFFGSFEKSWTADNFSLAEAGLESFMINKFLALRKNIDPKKEWGKIPDNIKIITIQDKNYPVALKETHSAPFILYIRGNISALNNISLAVVGTRKMTAYGQSVCEELTMQLAQRVITIVSGLADGIDTVAHGTCLKNHGTTVGVLGSGINNNCIFPAQNISLAEKIICQRGAIISEYPPNMKAQRQFFPARNRIISGLSLGTIVIEAPEKSGALITAYKALEQNKEVFAVPGSIYSSRTAGCHNLIKKGAKLVTNIQDILEELPGDIIINNPVETQNFASLPNINPVEKQILEIISASPTHIDKIIKSCRLSKSQVLSAITILEIKGIIKNIENNQYVIWQKISSSSSRPPKPEPLLNS